MIVWGESPSRQKEEDEDEGERVVSSLSSRLGVAGLWLAFACGCNVVMLSLWWLLGL